jgi:hypothetical protein
VSATPATRTLQQLSDSINELASEIMAMAQGLRNKEYADFLNGTPAQRQLIVNTLQLTSEQVDALVVASRESTASTPSGRPGAPNRQAQPWDYDTKKATIEDLTRREALLQTRLRVLQYLRSR